MRSSTELRAADSHLIDAYVSMPSGTPRGGLVVLQEIFGVTGHIRAVCDGYAQDGYAVVAPSLFDRVQRGVSLAYSEIPAGKALVEQTKPMDTMQDVSAAVEFARQFGKVGVVGFCWGGTLAFLSASALPIDAAVAYYGGMIAKFTDRKPKAPVLYHFGARDPFIPETDLHTIRTDLSPTDFYVYGGTGHGFNCDERADFSPEASALARTRTLEFLNKHVG